MEIPASAYPPIGAILAAIIAGGISFLIAVLSKDQKTSEFRQAWIDGLRNDLAEWISLAQLVPGVARTMIQHGKTPPEVIAHLIERDEQFHKLQMADAKIKLRLNPTEHQNLISALGALQKHITQNLMDSKTESTLVADIVRESQNVLKSEWKRVKRGESAFRATKAISLAIMVAAIVIGLGYATGHLHY